MNLENLIPAVTREVIARDGLHKVAAVMYGVDELNIKEAARLIGAKAFQRRKEARAIADGIVAFAAVNNEKVASNEALMALLRRAVAPAAMGAGIAAVPHLMSNDPQKGSPLPAMGIGALLGGMGGSMHAFNAATKGPVGPHMTQALNALP